MKKSKIILYAVISAISVLSLAGCRRTDYAENQVYAVMLGMDLTENQEIELTIRYPKLAGSSGGSGGGGTPAYASQSASGGTFQQALDNLKTLAPRDINLSALTMIVISEELVDAGKLRHALDGLTSNYRMYSASYLSICRGSAKEFVEGQEPQIGSRLSEGLKALVENSEEIGGIPGSRIADVYYRMDSVYSEPMIMLCRQEKKSGQPQEAAPDQSQSGGSSAENIYAGAVVIRDNKAVIELDAAQSILANVLSGDVKQFSYTNGDTAAIISVDKSPAVKISAKDRLSIDIKLKLSGMKMTGSADIRDIAGLIEKDIMEVIDICREAGAEPFGFADKAAAKFTDMESWEAYDWHMKFTESDINIELTLTELF